MTTPNSEQEFEEVARKDAYTPEAASRIIQAHQSAVTAAEVRLLEKLNSHSAVIGGFVRHSINGELYIKCSDIDAELKQRGQ